MAESIALLDASSRRSWLQVPSGRAESAAYYHTRSQNDGQSNLEASHIFEHPFITTNQAMSLKTNILAAARRPRGHRRHRAIVVFVFLASHNRANLTSHFQKDELFWVACCVAAIVVSFVLRETGRAAHPLPAPPNKSGLRDDLLRLYRFGSTPI